MDLYKLNTRIFSKSIDYKNEKNVMVYCFAHNISMIEHIVDGLKQHNIHAVHILKNIKEMSGLLNYEIIEKKYKELGITVDLIPFFEDMINTKNESNRVIEYALMNKIDNIIICSPTFHILRASLTIISSAIQKGVNINFSSIIVNNSNWYTPCITHQGNTKDIYHNVLELELDRIYEYTKKCDILSFKVIWDYLDKFV
jgi:hypothetical protein